ncbi:MAG TPA: hypothetical protein VMV56_12785 [Williamwhitmania sp.]|nr:hypothetical protein [Williamwhitmania sp.]
MKRVTLILAAAVAIGVLATSCNSTTQSKQQKDKVSTNNSSEKLSGTYVCTEHWNNVLVGEAKMIFGDDNKVSFAGIASASYRVKGDSLFIDMHTYEMPFKIDGNTLRASGPAGKVAYTKK